MAGHDPSAQMPDRAEGHERKAFDKSHTAAGGSSIILLLLVALGLIGAAAGLVVIGRDYVVSRRIDTDRVGTFAD